MQFVKTSIAVVTLPLVLALPRPAWADPTPECNIGPALGSTECGVNSTASGDGATAVGNPATASGARSTAVGTQTQATGTQAVAIGFQAQAIANNSAAVGPGAIATGLNASALGPFTRAGGIGASAIGNGANASGAGSIAAGVLSVASGVNSTAVGGVAVASGDFSTALGRRATATGANSLAVGQMAVAGAANATAIGNGANAGFANSTALGANVATSAENQVMLGGSGTHVRIGDIAASTLAQETASVALATVDANGVLGRNTVLLPTLAALQGASSLQSGRIDELFDLRRLDRRDMRQGIAAAVAMGQAAMPSEAGRTAYVLNGAVFRGSLAIGGSLLHRIDADVPLAFGIGFSFAGNKNNAVKAGVAGEF